MQDTRARQREPRPLHCRILMIQIRKPKMWMNIVVWRSPGNTCCCELHVTCCFLHHQVVSAHSQRLQEQGVDGYPPC